MTDKKTGASPVFLFYDFLRAKSEMHARTLRSAEHALAFSETWLNTIIDFLMKINNLYVYISVKPYRKNIESQNVLIMHLRGNP